MICDKKVTNRGHEMTSYRFYMFLKRSSVSTIFVLLFLLILTFNYLAFKNGVSLYSFHPSLLSIGWLLMTLAISIFSNFPILERKCNYKEKKKIHWMLQTLAVICIGIGFTVILLNKSISNKPHFQTWHSLFGLVSVFSCIPSIALGVTYSYSFSLRKIISPSLCKQLHLLFGVVTYLLLSSTVFLSIYSKWILNSEFTAEQLNIMKVLIVLSSIIIIQKPLLQLTKGLIT